MPPRTVHPVSLRAPVGQPAADLPVERNLPTSLGGKMTRVKLPECVELHVEELYPRPVNLLHKQLPLLQRPRKRPALSVSVPLRHMMWSHELVLELHLPFQLQPRGHTHTSTRERLICLIR